MNIKNSQNFLKNSLLVKKLVGDSSINNNDTVIEIGPGKGIITSELANRCKKVIAVEFDKNLSNCLKNDFASINNVEIINNNFLDYTLPKGDYKLFSNIPFNITADIMHKLFDSPNPPIESYLIIQREAAEKYGGFNSGTMTSILHKPWFTYEIIYNFKRNDFSPQPSVDSVLLHIKKLNNPLISDENNNIYKDFICYGFTSTKPTVKKTYSDIFSHVQFLRLASDFEFDPHVKPTDLRFDQWLNIFNYFINNNEEFRRRKVIGSYDKLLDQQKTLYKVHRTRKD